ncbi:MAG: flavoprotein, partial [Nitrososphaerales archaeon]
KTANKALEEGVRTVLVVRETPWSLIHLRNMLKAAERGALIMPPTIQPKPNQKILKETVAELADKIIDVSLKSV